MLNFFDSLFAFYELLNVEVAFLVRKILTLDTASDNFLVFVVHSKARHVRVIIGPLIVFKRKFLFF